VSVKPGCDDVTPMRRAACTLLLLALFAGCGGDDPAPRAAATATATPTPTPTPQPKRKRATVQRAHCPADADNCAVATGRVIYVEAVDPDGDGDAHYVLAGGRVTAPGLSVIDVAKDLRPRRLPKPGELVSAAGPVYMGSHGQHQIEAVELHHQRR
jgi:hypothetical protein